MTINGRPASPNRLKVPNKAQHMKSSNDSEKTIAGPDAEQPTSTSKPIDQPPDGGYGWVCVACCFWINAHTWGINSVSLLKSPCQQRTVLRDADTGIWRVPGSLHCIDCVSWRNLSGLCFRWGPLHLSSPLGVSSCHLHYPGLWYPDHSTAWSVPADPRSNWRIICHSNLATLPKSRIMLRLGSGVSVRWICRCCTAMVYEEKKRRQWNCNGW